ncbi:MAG: hypothetical protein ABSF28_21925 [Terracidiphilus sp.]
MSDADVLELFISASNKTFAGGASPYVDHGKPANLAAILQGFPKSASDVRELEFGTSGDGFAGGYVHLRFSCRDKAAHAIVEIQMESKNETRPDAQWNYARETAHFFAAIEPSAVDDFVSELRQFDKDNRRSAWLRFS